MNLSNPFISCPTPIPTFISKNVESKEAFPSQAAFTSQLKDHFITGRKIGRDKAGGRACGHHVVTMMKVGGNKLGNITRYLILDL